MAGQTRHSRTDGSRAGPLRVAYQGEPGAYSEQAIAQSLPAGRSIACTRMDDVFALLTSGDVERAVVPIENSYAGRVEATDELLCEHDVAIVDETRVAVRHCLLALPDAELADVEIARSHPQALAQCDAFLAEHGLEPQPCLDTAGAARQIAEQGDRSIAAVASHAAAEHYGLDVLAADVQARASNATRFLVIAREGEEELRDRYPTSWRLTDQ